MSQAEPIDVGDALETLVHQFSDPWSFLRELIQNAIDAGSPEIDVRIDHEPPTSDDPDDPGLMIVEIIDAGDGMDREIIDTRLTRLFSSAKDGDYTKIGRFGIGFVSVFAIDPDLVCLDTGKTGEYWRVLFRKDRSFQRIALDHPTEGTTIRIYKRASEDEVEQARDRARSILEYWCKHARVEIRCDDQLISRPFELDAGCVIRHEEDGTEVLIGYVGERDGLRGYYHAGLTLHEEHDDRLAHVAFKIDSRYLEHTLTRDNVIRDDNYEKAMKIVARLARGPLIEALVVELQRLTEAGEQGVDLEFLRRRLITEIASEAKLPKLVWSRPLVPSLTRTGAIELLALTEVRRRLGRCFRAREPSPVTAALVDRGETVLCYEPGSSLAHLVNLLGETLPRSIDGLCTAVPATDIEGEVWQPLRAVVIELLAKLRLEVQDMRLAHLAYPESAVGDRVAITQAKLGELTPVEEIGKLSSGWFGSKRVIVLNADHPTVQRLLELGAVEPELAAYLALKLFFLRTELGTERDSLLATHAAEVRWQRSTS